MNEEKVLRALKEVRSSCSSLTILFTILYLILLQFTTSDKLTITGVAIVTCIGIRTFLTIFIAEYEK